MRRTATVFALGFAMSLLSACRVDFFGLNDDDVSFRVEHDRYTFQQDDHGVVVAIPFRYTNETDRTIYVVNCNRIAPPSLEKLVGDDWVLAWGAVVPECLSAPIVIAPGATYRDVLHVFGGHEDNNYYPKFAVDDIEGTYRLLWHNVLWSFSPNRYPFGEELPAKLRRSNTFKLDAPS